MCYFYSARLLKYEVSTDGYHCTVFHHFCGEVALAELTWCQRPLLYFLLLTLSGKMSKLKDCRRASGLFCTTPQSPLASMNITSTFENICGWCRCSFRLLRRLLGDDAYPSKTALRNTRIIYRQIYDDFLNLFIYLVSFIYYSDTTLTQLSRITPFSM